MFYIRYVAKEHDKILHKSGFKNTDEAKCPCSHTADLYFKGTPMLNVDVESDFFYFVKRRVGQIWFKPNEDVL